MKNVLPLPMAKTKSRFAWLLPALLVAAGVPWRVQASDVDAVVKAGTPGMGVDLTFGGNDVFKLRAGLNYLALKLEPEDDDGDQDDNITVKLNLLTMPVLIDWHPFRNGFRLSAGVAYNRNRLSLRAEPGDEIELNKVDYRVESFSMGVDFNPYCPYFSLGYGNVFREGGRFGIAIELGFIYHGSPRVSARAEASNPILQAALNRDLATEIEDLEEDLKPFKFYPVVSLGLAYRF